MNAADFAGSSAGTLVPAAEGRMAFVPSPAPRALEMSPELVLALDEARGAIGELAGVGEALPNPHLLVRPFLRREAVLSSRIEGTQASLTELSMFEAGARRGVGDALEVRNYLLAVERGRELLADLPICGRLVLETHEALMHGVRGAEKRPGEWRDRQVWVGPPGTPIDEARYVPAPAPEIPRLMSDWERFVNGPGRLPPLVACALMHYQFEAIHPFLDGNGRIGRVLITLFLEATEVLRTPLLYLSAFFERNRAEYYDQLLRVSMTGAWEPWVAFFLRGVIEQARDALARSRRLRDLRESYRQGAQAASHSPNALRIVDDLFVLPVISAPQAARLLGVTPQGSRRILDRLVKAGVLAVAADHRPRLYYADELIAILDAPQAEETPD